MSDAISAPKPIKLVKKSVKTDYGDNGAQDGRDQAQAIINHALGHGDTYISDKESYKSTVDPRKVSGYKENINEAEKDYLEAWGLAKKDDYKASMKDLSNQSRELISARAGVLNNLMNELGSYTNFKYYMLAVQENFQLRNGTSADSPEMLELEATIVDLIKDGFSVQERDEDGNIIEGTGERPDCTKHELLDNNGEPILRNGEQVYTYKRRINMSNYQRYLADPALKQEIKQKLLNKAIRLKGVVEDAKSSSLSAKTPLSKAMKNPVGFAATTGAYYVTVKGGRGLVKVAMGKAMNESLTKWGANIASKTSVEASQLSVKTFKEALTHHAKLGSKVTPKYGLWKRTTSLFWKGFGKTAETAITQGAQRAAARTAAEVGAEAALSQGWRMGLRRGGSFLGRMGLRGVCAASAPATLGTSLLFLAATELLFAIPDIWKDDKDRSYVGKGVSYVWDQVKSFWS